MRIVTDEGLSGYGQAETWKRWLKPHILAFREALVGEDPRLVERVMRRIRQRGGFKPWGSAVSVMRWRSGTSPARPPGCRAPPSRRQGARPRPRLQRRSALPAAGRAPEDYAEDLRRPMALPEGFTIIKQPIGFHSPMKREVPGFYYGEPTPGAPSTARSTAGR